MSRVVSSVAEHSTADREVAGSTPAVPFLRILCQGLAHEHIILSFTKLSATDSIN